MQRAHNQVAKRQNANTASVPDVGSFSGDATASTGFSLGTSLLVGTTGTAGASTASATNLLLPSQDTITPPTTPTNTVTSATSSTSSSTSSSSSLSMGAVVGITVAAFVVVIGAMFALYANFKRRTASRARPATARGPPPSRVVRGAGGGSGSRKEKQLRPKGGLDHGDSNERPISGATNITTGKIALFEKDLSVRSLSDEKANVPGSDNNTFDPSAMPDFTKYTALTDDPTNLPPPRPFIAREEVSPVVSWDSDADPLLSLRASASGTMSPSSVTARQTPRAIGDSALHHWESAEVLIMDEHTTERPSVYSDVTQNPFHDNSAPRPSNSGSDSSDFRAGGRNPFFSAGQQNPFSDRPTRSRKSSVSTTKRSRSNSSGSTVRAGAGEGALLSLIAALEKPTATPDEYTIRTSLQTVTTSIYSPTEPGVSMPAPKAF